MSSLKFIMDVDVDPLESHASYQRSREAAVQQAPSPPRSSPRHRFSHGDLENARSMLDEAQRLSQPAMTMMQASPLAHSPISGSRYAAQTVPYSPEPNPAQHHGSKSTGNISISSKETEPAGEIPVKYTPVTGRVSKAKKGVPVHTCTICRPPKTFTRAEHLRRHQKSHQDPMYTCTYQNCEKAFHRPDLLARHINRHETQGEEAYKPTDSKNRKLSGVSSQSMSPIPADTHQQPRSPGPHSASGSSTPGAAVPGQEREKTGKGDGFSPVTRSFQAVNFSNAASHEILPTTLSQNAESIQFQRTPRASMESGLPERSDPVSSQTVGTVSGLPRYVEAPRPQSHPMYASDNNSSLPLNHASTRGLPILKIPEQSYTSPVPYHRDGPWVSSAENSGSMVPPDRSEHARRWDLETPSTSTLSWPVQGSTVQWATPSLSPPPAIPPVPGIRAAMGHADETEPTHQPDSSHRMQETAAARDGYILDPGGAPSLSTYNKPLPQGFASTPFGVADIEYSGATRPGTEGTKTRALETLTIESLVAADAKTLSQLDEYLSSFWKYFAPLCPIIHQGTFKPWDDIFLSAAIAAIGSQYHNSTVARQRGVDLHEICRICIGLHPPSSLAFMQATLLYEIFRRFRGRKTTVQCSRHFEELYRRLRERSLTGMDSFSCVDMDVDEPNHKSIDSPSEWRRWIDIEARHRLLLACFIFDVHQGIYHEQSRCVPEFDLGKTPLRLPCPEILWECRDETEWEATRQTHSPYPPEVLGQHHPSPAVLSSSPLSQWLYICYYAANLPTREMQSQNHFLPYGANPALSALSTTFQDTSIAHMYLAMYHTPLHDLLAVTGQTWLFSKKLTADAFNAACTRLRTWSLSLDAAAAAHHACFVLRSSLLEQSSWGPRQSRPHLLSEYWSFYAATLICWAFGHRYGGRNTNTLQANGPDSTAVTGSASSMASLEQSRVKALTYTTAMLQLSIEELVTSKATMRGDTAALIETVRSCLQEDAANGRSMMLVDAVCVLDRIREGGRGKLF